MFSRKKYIQNESISALEKRICDLENPYKFNFGDIIWIEYQINNEFYKGIVVDIKHEYNNAFHRFTSDWIMVSSYPLEFTKDGNFKRANKYLIYIEDFKNSVWRYEHEIKTQNNL